MNIRSYINLLKRYPDFLFRLVILKRLLRTYRQKEIQRWVLHCPVAGFIPFLMPYFRYGSKFGDVVIYFVVGYANEQSPKTELISRGVPTERILEPIDYVTNTEWDVYMCPTAWGNAFPCNLDAIKVQIFHTLGDKNMMYGKELLKFDVLFANGPIHQEFMEQKYFSKYPEARQKCRVVNAGFAKIDDLFDGSYSKVTIRNSLNIRADDHRPIILYAPNWESTSALHKYGETVFQILANTDNIVLFKLHHLSLFSPEDVYATGGIDWRCILERYRGLENVRIIYDSSINEYLYFADLMVTDYGGASLEFMCLNKPIVYLDCPEFFLERGNHIFENRARETGYIIDDPILLPETIKKALHGDGQFKQKRHDLVKRMNYYPGTAAENGFNAIYQMVREKFNKKGDRLGTLASLQ